jgi:uncharacterized membrane protein
MAKKRKRIITMLKSEYKIGDTVPASAIYECSECEEIAAFKKGEVFPPCERGHEEQDWYRTNQFVHFVSKNLNTEFDKIETVSLRLADFIAEWAGTVGFVFFHILWFGLWMYVNTGNSLWGVSGFDPYPFGLLTMIVSLEAIFLSTFILISQNRQSAKSELRAELDYQTNLKTEKDVAEVLSILHQLREEGRVLDRRTDEVLQDVSQMLKKPKRSEKGARNKGASKKGVRSRGRSARLSRSRREQKADAIIEDAGIDVVQPDE